MPFYGLLKATENSLPKQSALSKNLPILYVSIASIWELGKLETELSLARIVQESDVHQSELLPVQPADVVTMCSLECIHRDPFDRMIIAHALNGDFVVVTKDKWFDAYDVKRLWSR
jgi:PIN domain nuclease of toxin-antitoxin system